MMKRLLCLTLCALMLLGTLVLSGCSTSTDGEDEDIEKEASRGTTTLNMMVMTEDNTDPEQAAAVEEAINKITKSRFKTKVNIIFLPEGEYYQALEQSFADKEAEVALKKEAETALKRYIKEHRSEYGKDGAQEKFYEEYPEYLKYKETTTDPTAETTPEETVYNEDTGLLELKYPEADPNVIDIFFIGGYERFQEYIEKEWINRIDDELTSGSKKLKDYVSDVFMESVKIEGATYAVPNNRTIGEYTYMLVNKELLAKYFYDASSFNGLADCQEFLEDIVRFEPDVVPIDGAPGLYNVLYWDIDPDTLKVNKNNFSIIGTTYSTTASYGTQLQFTSLFASKKAFRDQLLTNKLYEERGYFKSNVAADATCAIKIVSGGAELEKIYSDTYEMVVLESPHAETDDIFASMFAVGGYSNDVSRAMEIITYINTNAEMRNLLQYGIENVNYTLDENGQVTYTEDNKYWMDLTKTGNAFIAYTLSGTDPEVWEYGMKQNRDATVDMLLGFSFEEADVDTDLIKKIQALSVQVQQRLDACKTYDELKALIDTLTTELRPQSNADIKRYTSPPATLEDDDNAKETPYSVLYEWMESMGFITDD